MASLAARGVFCCLECCCSQVVEALKRLLGNERVSKIFYVFLVIAFVVPGIFIFFFIHRFQSFVDYFSKWFSCPQSSQGGQQFLFQVRFECFGASAVYRLSLSLLCMFFIMMVLMVCRNRCAMVINQGLFFIKYLFVVGLFIAFLWVPNEMFIEYADVSKYLSILFMILQVLFCQNKVIILIDLFYMAGIRMVKHYDAGQTQYGCYLVFLTLIIEAAAITINVLGYVTFSNQEEGCTKTLWVNVINSIILVLLPVLQFFNFNVQNSLLTTALVSLYVSYLSYVSQFSYPDSGSQCQRMSLDSLIGDVIVSTFFFILTMYGSIQGGSGQVKVSANGDLNKTMGVAPTTEPQSEEQRNRNNLREQLQLQKQERIPQSYEDWTWVKWHFYMCLSSMYIGMLITNWGAANLTTNTLEPTSFGFWVRIILSWTTTILYIWTLIAPKVFPNRDFIVQ